MADQHNRYLPIDLEDATLVGRAWLPASSSRSIAGPSPILVRSGEAFDLFHVAPTVSQLLNRPDLTDRLTEVRAVHRIGSLADLINASLDPPEDGEWKLLSPVDLQPVKACGVTFACSMIERVIEEQAGGDAVLASELRADIVKAVGDDLSAIVPGSPDAGKLKKALQQKGIWSQYLEVGIGPDAEVFSKAQPMSSVGLGAEIGINSISVWNNPEPEVVLIINAECNIVGATLGNDVNLRDVEGRSALLLGKAKDNNASCALGPFIRLLDHQFTLHDIRDATVSLQIEGPEGYTLADESRMSEISRDIEDLVAQTCGSHHQYPDGFALMTGTLFAPTADRDEPGSGFTHKIGDVVRISSPSLGCLQNKVTTSERAAPWTFGTGALFENIQARLAD